MQLKLGTVPDLCFCFAKGKYLAPCDVALGEQLWDLAGCNFRLRLGSHMTSVVKYSVKQTDLVMNIFIQIFLKHLSNMPSLPLTYKVCNMPDLQLK